MLVAFSLVAKGAVTTESHTVSFSESDYMFTYDENGSLIISAVDGDATYSSPNEPGLPLRSLSLAIPGTRKYESSSLSFSKRLIRSNVTLAPGPIPVTTDGTMEPVPARTVSYGNVTYPASNCLYTLSSEWSDLSMIHFLTTPFIYDAGARKLYFIDSIQLTVRTVERPSGETSVATFAPRAIVCTPCQLETSQGPEVEDNHNRGDRFEIPGRIRSAPDKEMSVRPVSKQFSEVCSAWRGRHRGNHSELYCTGRHQKSLNPNRPILCLFRAEF